MVKYDGEGNIIVALLDDSRVISKETIKQENYKQYKKDFDEIVELLALNKLYHSLYTEILDYHISDDLGATGLRSYNLVGGNPTQKVVPTTSSSESWVEVGNNQIKRRQLGIRVSIEPRNSDRNWVADVLLMTECNIYKYVNGLYLQAPAGSERPNHDTQ